MRLPRLQHILSPLYVCAVMLILTGFAFIPVALAQSIPADQETDPFFALLLPLAYQFMALGGFAALGTALVNIAKFAKWAKDGDAPKWAAAIQGVLFVVFLGLKFFMPGFNPEAGSETAGQIAQLLLNALQLATQFGLGKVFHAGLRGVPVIGKSFSAS